MLIFLILLLNCFIYFIPSMVIFILLMWGFFATVFFSLFK